MKQLLTILVLFVSTSAWSQEPTLEANSHVQENQQEILEANSFLYQTIQESISNHRGDVSLVSRLLDPSFTMTRQILDVKSSITKSETTYSDFKTHLQALSSIPNLTVQNDIETILFVKSYDQIAIVGFSMFVSADIKGEPLVKYRSFITNYFKKGNDGKWLLLESTGLNVYKDQEVGVCPMAIVQPDRSKSNYTVTIMVPGGINFQTEILRFDFKNVDNQKLVTCNNNQYLIQNNVVTCIKEGNTKVNTLIGKSTSETETIHLIIDKHLFSGKCIGYKQLDR